MFVDVTCIETFKLFQSIFDMDRLNSEIIIHLFKLVKDRNFALLHFFSPKTFDGNDEAEIGASNEGSWRE